MTLDSLPEQSEDSAVQITTLSDLKSSVDHSMRSVIRDAVRQPYVVTVFSRALFAVCGFIRTIWPLTFFSLVGNKLN